MGRLSKSKQSIRLYIATVLISGIISFLIKGISVPFEGIAHSLAAISKVTLPSKKTCREDLGELADTYNKALLK